MKKIRIGKDIAMVWGPITTRGEALPLEGRNLTVVLRSNYGKEISLPYKVIESDKLSFSFFGKDQQYRGAYSLTLWENLGMIGETAVDKLLAFELVPTTNLETDNGGSSNLQVETIDLGSDDLVPGIRGLSAYEIAVLHGFVGTEEEWLEFLGKPAKDAAAALDAKFLSETNKLKQDYETKTAALKSDYDKKSAALQADYENKSQALSKDYGDVKLSLNSNYDSVKAKLDSDYKAAKAQIAAAYQESLNGIDKWYANKLVALASAYTEKQQALEQTITAKMNEAVKTSNDAAKTASDAATAANEEATKIAALRKNMVYKSQVSEVEFDKDLDTQEYHRLVARVVALEMAVNVLRNQDAQLSNSIAQMSNSITQLNIALAQSNNRVEQINSSLAQTNNRLEQTNSNLTQTNNRLTQINTDLQNKITQAKSEMSSSLATTKQGLEAEIKKTNTKVAAVKENVVYRKTIKTV